MERQYGFQTKQYTALALMKITEEIATAIESNKHTIVVFIDFKHLCLSGDPLFPCTFQTASKYSLS